MSFDRNVLGRTEIKNEIVHVQRSRQDNVTSASGICN